MKTARHLAHERFTTGRIPDVGETIVWCAFGSGGDAHSAFCDTIAAAILAALTEIREACAREVERYAGLDSSFASRRERDIAARIRAMEVK
jgi:hypothetical protein